MSEIGVWESDKSSITSTNMLLDSVLKSKSGGGKWNITLISHPNSSLHCPDPQVCPFDKQHRPCCLSNLSQFVCKLSKDQSAYRFLWATFTQQNICPPETLPLCFLLKLLRFTLVWPSAGCSRPFCFCLGRPAPLSWDSGLRVQSNFHQCTSASCKDFLFHVRGKRAVKLQVGCPLDSTWAFLTPLVHADS